MNKIQWTISLEEKKINLPGSIDFSIWNGNSLEHYAVEYSMDNSWYWRDVDHPGKLLVCIACNCHYTWNVMRKLDLLFNSLWYFKSFHIYLTPAPCSPFGTTLLCTVCYIHRFLIKTITIIDQLIGRFTDASNISNSVAPIASSRAWWPSACSPNIPIVSKNKQWIWMKIKIDR